MKQKIFLALIAAFFVAPLSAALNEEAYEVEASLIQLPISISGNVIVRECIRCETFTHRVTANTRYTLNGTTTTLDRIKGLLSNARQQGAVFVVGYDIENRNVTFISLDI